ncbi:MAG: carbohydrate binding family 9 domain-containing protein [Balneolaceae bacterium]|nr:carbohydrate binding family 9 domain-containing protein [Balneolaceae bacterium]
MFEPVYRGEMSDKTLIRVAYDNHNLYVAGELYTSNPSDIRVNTLSRDGYSEDDIFALVVDPFNDNENALWFITNPAGVRVDMAISNDADFSSGRPMNDTWNTHWEVETTRTPEGWFAEMRIPFSSIGLQVRDGRAEIGFITYRYLSKGVRRHIYPPIPPEWALAFAKPSQARDVVLEGVESRRPLYLKPDPWAVWSASLN